MKKSAFLKRGAFAVAGLYSLSACSPEMEPLADPEIEQQGVERMLPPGFMTRLTPEGTKRQEIRESVAESTQRSIEEGQEEVVGIGVTAHGAYMDLNGSVVEATVYSPGLLDSEGGIRSTGMFCIDSSDGSVIVFLPGEIALGTPPAADNTEVVDFSDGVPFDMMCMKPKAAGADAISF